MAQSTDTNQIISTCLTDWLASLCHDESTHLTRAPGKGEVKARIVDPSEKPRTAGARTAGG